MVDLRRGNPDPRFTKERGGRGGGGRACDASEEETLGGGDIVYCLGSGLDRAARDLLELACDDVRPEAAKRCSKAS